MSLLIRKEGVFASIQKPGSSGARRFGIRPRGPMDTTAARVANLLLGNAENAAILETCFPAPEIEFLEHRRIVLAGADFAAELDGTPASAWTVHLTQGASKLRFTRKISGSWCCVAVEGGLVEAVSPEAGFATHRLRQGDTIGCGPHTASKSAVGRAAGRGVRPAYGPSPTIRIIAGAEFDILAPPQKELLETSEFAVSVNSDRMGYRLEGPEIKLSQTPDLVSAAVTFGTIQLLPSGQMILLMADHQTSGGYPRLANVIAADLPLAAQLGPGEKMRFRIVPQHETEQAILAMEHDLSWLKTGLSFGRYR